MSHPQAPHAEGLETLRLERDFLRRLLDLGAQDEIEPLLSEALSLIVDVTGAERGYLELGTGRDSAATWWLAHGCSDRDVEAIRDTVSRGVIAEAMTTGRTVHTESALVDSRFESRESVRRHGIEAALCAPVGKPPPLGVVYLQGWSAGGPFRSADQERAELFARQLAAVAEVLLNGRRTDRATDYTAGVRARFACESITGRSRGIAKVLEQAALIAPLDVDVLLTGPSGTGKTALAQVIAQNSSRRSGPMVELNCAAIPDGLIESELFGAVKGAHSTAVEAVPGKVAASDGGTLFLDEISELSSSAQAKLLQLLQSRRYYPLGASEPVVADIRVIAATNADLKELVGQRRFREDLFYRLHVMPLSLPSLGQRRDDIELLVAHFIEKAARRHGLRPAAASPAALIACREAPWPGNVRELANTIEAAVIRAHGDGSQRVETHHVFPERDANGEPADSLSFREATLRFQRRFLDEALEQGDWNVTAVARKLDLTRSHMYNLINAHGLRRESSE